MSTEPNFHLLPPCVREHDEADLGGQDNLCEYSSARPQPVDRGKHLYGRGKGKKGMPLIVGSKGQGCKEVQMAASTGFLDLEDGIEDQLLNIGETATKQKDNWARKKFDAWRKHSCLECETPLEKIELTELNKMMTRFFLVVCKDGGALYPSDTLMGMFRCFNRLIRKEQDNRVALSGVCEVPFDILKNPIFKSTQQAIQVAMKRSVSAGVCKERKKASVIGVSLEEEILRDIDFSIQHSRGCQMRFAFYCMMHFCIRGGLELYKLERSMFSRGNDELGAYVRFSERLSKNYKVDLLHYQPEHFRPPVTVRDNDVLATFDQLMRHMPPIIEGEKNLIYLFLQPISSPRTEIWYNKNRVSAKVLSGIIKTIGERSGAGNYCNKSLRNTCVTRMSLGQVPRDVGMLVTGHKRATSYEKYDLSSEVRVAAAQEILSHPFDEEGKLKTYPRVLEEKFSNFCQNVEGAGSQIDDGGNSEKTGVGGKVQIVKNTSGSGSVEVQKPGGIFFVPYKIGDDLPFDEDLLKGLPIESARALGLPHSETPSPAMSFLSGCNLNNCVVNVYMGKENMEGSFGK